MKISHTIIFLITLILFGCQSDDTKKFNKTQNLSTLNKRKQNLNISILLDLSDRISPSINPNTSMEFYKRDLGYIESIANGFKNHIRTKPIKQMNDHIQIYFEPEPLNNSINSLAINLKLSFTKDNTTKESISKISQQYVSTSHKIYELAMKDKKFPGSDIWGFFKNKVNDYTIKSEHRNILFILTDGYMFHNNAKFSDKNKTSYITPRLLSSLKLNTPEFKNHIKQKKYGFILANENLSNLEVVVLGVNPSKGNPFEGDVIHQYWKDWLVNMKVKSSMIKLSDLPSNLDPIIQKYITQTPL